MVQWLIVCTSTAGGMGLIPGLVGELKSHMPHGVAKKKKKLRMDWMSSVWQCCDKGWCTVSVFKEFIV